MNTPDLIKKVNETLKKTGLLDEITEHIRQNPQLWGKTTDGKKLISAFDVTISMVANDLKDIQKTDYSVYINCGQIDSALYGLNVCTYSIEQFTWIKGERVTEARYVL